jgi:hypothetical protein
MNFILNQKYSDGNTPIRPEEAEQLIPRISTMGELNKYEASASPSRRAISAASDSRRSSQLFLTQFSKDILIPDYEQLFVG